MKQLCSSIYEVRLSAAPLGVIPVIRRIARRNSQMVRILEVICFFLKNLFPHRPLSRLVGIVRDTPVKCFHSKNLLSHRPLAAPVRLALLGRMAGSFETQTRLRSRLRRGNPAFAESYGAPRGAEFFLSFSPVFPLAPDSLRTVAPDSLRTVAPNSLRTVAPGAKRKPHPFGRGLVRRTGSNFLY